VHWWCTERGDRPHPRHHGILAETFGLSTINKRNGVIVQFGLISDEDGTVGAGETRPVLHVVAGGTGPVSVELAWHSVSELAAAMSTEAGIQAAAELTTT